MERLARAVRNRKPEEICSALRNLDGSVPNSRWLLEKIDELKTHLPGKIHSEEYNLRVAAYGVAFAELLLRTLDASEEEKDSVREALAYHCVQNREKLKELASSNPQLAKKFVERVLKANDKVKNELDELTKRRFLDVEKRTEVDDHLGNGLNYTSWLQLFMGGKEKRQSL